MEPTHEDASAIACFNRILQLDPGCSPSKIWLAYCHLHYSMDPVSERAARQLLEGVLGEHGRLRAAALMISASLGSDSGDLDTGEVIHLLEQSVATAPDWVNNRLFLGVRYAEMGRITEMDAELAAALENIIEAQPHWSIGRRMFEMSITGRTSFGVARWLQQLREHLPKDPQWR